MAQKIAVLNSEAENPKTYVKKSAAAMLVRRMLAYWVVKNISICRLQVCTSTAIPASTFHAVSSVYIPDEMPPVIDKRLGVRFEDPNKLPRMPRFRRLSNFDRMQQFEL